METYIKISDKH